MAVAAIERKIGSVVGGKYRLLRVVGRGGMGIVYEAEHAMTRRRVAVKLLHPRQGEVDDAARRFINEARASGRVSHPNVVEVLDAGEDGDGALYLVLELLTGHDLASLLSRKRRLEIADAVSIAAQILQALSVAHFQGIVHRDIKPENVFLVRGHTGEMHVKVLDFGISKAIHPIDPTEALSVTQTNTAVGTPYYMAPEQARGERTIDPRADLWAVGVVMYECLSGQVPFDGESYNDQIVRLITEAHRPLVELDVPEGLSVIVDRALEKDRTKRYLRAEEMIGDLRRFVESHPEYGAIPPQYLREPVIDQSIAPLIRTDDPSAAPARTPVRPAAIAESSEGPGASSVIASKSLFDAMADEGPTTVRNSPLGENGSSSAQATDPMARVPSSPQSPTAMDHGEQVGPADRRRTGIAAGLVVAAMVLGGVAAAISTRVQPAAAPVAGRDAMVTLRFVGLPRGAQLIVGGTPIYNSETAIVPRSGNQVAVEIRPSDGGPLRFSLVPDRDQTIPLSIEAERNVTAPAPIANTIVATQPGALLDREAPIHRARTTATRATQPGGHLVITAPSSCSILIDRERVQVSRTTRIAVESGTHAVVCRTRSGAIRSRTVSVSPGQAVRVTFDP